MSRKTKGSQGLRRDLPLPRSLRRAIWKKQGGPWERYREGRPTRRSNDSALSRARGRNVKKVEKPRGFFRRLLDAILKFFRRR